MEELTNYIKKYNQDVNHKNDTMTKYLEGNHLRISQHAFMEHVDTESEGIGCGRMKQWACNVRIIKTVLNI